MNEIELDPEEVAIYAERIMEYARELEALLARLDASVSHAAEGWRDESMLRVAEKTVEIGKSLNSTFDRLDELRQRIHAEIEWAREYQGIR